MKLFVGVRLDRDVAGAIAGFRDALQQRVTRDAPAARLNWVKDEQFHITVRFIGHADETELARIQDSLTEPIPVHPFEVSAAGAGAFPASGAPRVLWAGITAGRDSLAAVEREVSGRLASCGIAREERPYSPHITLARVREPGGLRARVLLDGLAVPGFGSWRVGAITLFDSRQTGRGQEYVPLQSTDLR